MKIVLGTVFCIIALAFSALPVAHGMHHDHGGLTATAAMHESGSGDHSDTGPMGLEDCGTLPGHCSYAAVMLAAETVAALYATDMSTVLLDDLLQAKHRPEMELPPPKV